jgi:hypothetical protein
MNIQRVAVTVTLNVDVCNLPEGITWDQVAEMLQRNTWDEGRYPFHREMIHEGLAKALEGAIGAAVWQQMQEQHGNATITTKSGTASLACAEAEKAMRGVSAHVFDDIRAASIGPARDHEGP